MLGGILGRSKKARNTVGVDIKHTHTSRDSLAVIGQTYSHIFSGVGGLDEYRDKRRKRGGQRREWKNESLHRPQDNEEG